MCIVIGNHITTPYFIGILGIDVLPAIEDQEKPETFILRIDVYLYAVS